MSEIYTGTKFKYIHKYNDIPQHKEFNLLISWCNIFAEQNFAPPYPGGSSGNLSIRSKSNTNNFIITASHTALRSSMTVKDFSEVIFYSADKNIIHANGKKEPSSESIMHYLIYKNRPEINAIFHGHSEEIMRLAKKEGFPETEKEYEYGTAELANEVVNTLKLNNFVIIKNHGFVSLGKTQQEAGKRVIKLKEKK